MKATGVTGEERKKKGLGGGVDDSRRILCERERLGRLLDFRLLLLLGLDQFRIVRVRLAVPDQAEEAILVERLELVLLDQFEFLRTGVRTEDDVGGF